MYVRFQTPWRSGIFAEAKDFGWDVRARAVRLPRRTRSEFDHTFDALWRLTPPPPVEAYKHPLCRYPLTWFKMSASDHVRLAWRLCEIMQKWRSPIRPLKSRTPGEIIWQDDCQIVVVPPRGEELGTRPPPPAAVPFDCQRDTIRRWSREAKRCAGLQSVGEPAAIPWDLLSPRPAGWATAPSATVITPPTAPPPQSPAPSSSCTASSG